jgi:hypothetical protein
VDVGPTADEQVTTRVPAACQEDSTSAHLTFSCLTPTRCVLPSKSRRNRPS